MKKDLGVILGLFLVIVALLFFGHGFTSNNFVRPRAASSSASLAVKGLTIVTAKSLTVNAMIAKTQSERQKGLSKLDSLPLNQGMLFVFDNNGVNPFWMKDMKFAIDIIWIDQNKKIVSILQDVPPEPGKSDSELTIYKPPVESRYVLEINAGLSKLNSLMVGDSVDFQL